MYTLNYALHSQNPCPEGSWDMSRTSGPNACFSCLLAFSLFTTSASSSSNDITSSRVQEPAGILIGLRRFLVLILTLVSTSATFVKLELNLITACSWITPVVAGQNLRKKAAHFLRCQENPQATLTIQARFTKNAPSFALLVVSDYWSVWIDSA